MTKFRILLITIFILAAECAPLDKQKIAEIGKLCRSETGMDVSILEKVKLTQRLPEPTETYLKYIECSYKKQGYLDEEGHVIFDTIKDMLTTFYPTSALDGILDPCKSQQHEANKPSERAYKAARCIIEALHAYEENLSNNILGIK